MRAQCRFIVLAIQEAYHGDEFLQDVVVDFVVTVYPRIVSPGVPVSSCVRLLVESACRHVSVRELPGNCCFSCMSAQE